MKLRREFFGCLLLLTAASLFGQQDMAFFRIVSPTNSRIMALSSDGKLTWTNATIAGVTCTVQRAATVTGQSNWVDYVRHNVTNKTMELRVFALNPPSGMVYIPSGVFTMGNFGTLGEEKHGDVETPLHTVYVSAYYMDKFETTWAKWKEVRAWSLTNGYAITGVAAGKADNHPVYNVSWLKAIEWCNARSQMEGRVPVYYNDSAFTEVTKLCSSAPYARWDANGFRLPTEAEWEKAARGGVSVRRFPWGDFITHNQANYYAAPQWFRFDLNVIEGFHPNYNNGTEPYTSPVGSFAPNGYGVFDMTGNLIEWCWDFSSNTYYSMSPVDNPRGPAFTGIDDYRIIRGGSWYRESAFACRVAWRQGLINYFHDGNIGFRTVVSAYTK